MKKWNAAEISALVSSVEAAGSVSTGIRNFMAENPARSFQACSHVYYKIKNSENVGEAVNEAPITHNNEVPVPAIEADRISFFTWFVNLFKKLFRKA